MRILITLGIGLLALVGCRTTESVQEASSVAVVAPVAVPVVAYGSSRSVAQQGSISVGAPRAWYSKEVTQDELKNIAIMNNHKFVSPWEYMGTRDGYHYLVLYPFIDFGEYIGSARLLILSRMCFL